MQHHELGSGRPILLGRQENATGTGTRLPGILY
jgi:hypothetical protein